MPEANVLYTVTAVVVAGLVVWVLASLKMAKQPWARPEAAAAIAASKAEKREADVPVEEPAAAKPVESGEDEKPADDAKPAEEEQKEEEKKSEA